MVGENDKNDGGETKREVMSEIENEIVESWKGVNGKRRS